ncbi:MAG TPA: flagellar biosynthesis protein FlhB [Ignavibacteriaceae bacterium]|nr:flagellar biosynthesis protein FlhB [Ignavibacteriaceae bacterium]
MAEAEGQEKTEQPSSKKLQEGREKGMVAKSVEINSFAIFTTGLLILYLSHRHIGSMLSELAVKIFNSLDSLEINKNLVSEYALEGFLFFLVTVAPVMVSIMIVAFIASVAQTGFKITPKALIPSLDKFNPIKGIKKLLFSSKSMMELGKSIVKLLIIGIFAYLILEDLIASSTKLVDLTVDEVVSFMISSGYSFLWKIALVFGIISAVDFIFQRKKFTKDMMMTKQELKEEHKQSEGDPIVKSKIRKIQMQMARSRMMREVPAADVVITNPTHYAIALKYEMDEDPAPKVIAKGVDELAQRIKEIAVNNNVPLHEDRELARQLYKLCDVGDRIPSAFFHAVAQILAYVYQLKNNKAKKTII